MGKYSITQIDFVSLRGQSNAGGQGDVSDDLPVGYQGAQTGVNIYYKTTRTSTDDGAWAALTPGTNNHGDPAVAGNDFFGVESKLFKDLKDSNSWNPYVSKSSIGGTSIVDHLTAAAAGIVSNDYYDEVALSKLVKDGFPRLKYVLFIQGYSDCTSLAASQTYDNSLYIDAVSWMNDMRTQFSTLFKSIPKDDVKLVVVESPDYVDGATNPTYVDNVQAAQLAFASAVKRNNYSIAKPSVVTFNGGVTGIHWDGESLIRYSDLIYAVVKDF